jgi:hypothetical protein
MLRDRCARRGRAAALAAVLASACGDEAADGDGGGTSGAAGASGSGAGAASGAGGGGAAGETAGSGGGSMAGQAGDAGPAGGVAGAPSDGGGAAGAPGDAGCPDEPWKLAGQPCAVEQEGLHCDEPCPDPCKICTLIFCHDGAWLHAHVFPDPNECA